MTISIKNKVLNKINTNIGKCAIYFDPKYSDEFILNFVSDINQVGKFVDSTIKNNSKIIIVSDTELTNHPVLGPHFVTKVLASNGQCMWVSTCFIGLI